MKKERSSNLQAAAQLASLRHDLIAQLARIEGEIGRLTPPKVIAEMLLSGNVSSGWYVQRLIDSGHETKDALEALDILRQCPGGGCVKEITEIDEILERSANRSVIRRPERRAIEMPRLNLKVPSGDFGKASRSRSESEP